MYLERENLSHFGGFGRYAHLHKKCVCKSAIGRTGIGVASRQGRFAWSALRFPAAYCHGMWWSMRTILGPRPTTIHFSCGPGSNLCIVTLVCTPVCLTGVLSNLLLEGGALSVWQRLLLNSFSVHVQPPNMRQ